MSKYKEEWSDASYKEPRRMGCGRKLVALVVGSIIVMMLCSMGLQAVMGFTLGELIAYNLQPTTATVNGDTYNIFSNNDVNVGNGWFSGNRLTDCAQADGRGLSQQVCQGGDNPDKYQQESTGWHFEFGGNP